MGCACGNKKTNGSTQSYVHTSPTGERKTYRSEVEAAAAAKRVGGTYRAQ
jgi:hypothetical protein